MRVDEAQAEEVCWLVCWVSVGECGGDPGKDRGLEASFGLKAGPMRSRLPANGCGEADGRRGWVSGEVWRVQTGLRPELGRRVAAAAYLLGAMRGWPPGPASRVCRPFVMAASRPERTAGCGEPWCARSFHTCSSLPRASCQSSMPIRRSVAAGRWRGSPRLASWPRPSMPCSEQEKPGVAERIRENRGELQFPRVALTTPCS